MKKNNKLNLKLVLDRETLVSLQTDDLNQVNGGFTPIVVASISGFAASVALSQALCPSR